MLAKELVTILEENNPDYSRQELLQEINYVQRTIFGAANMYTLVVDDATGQDPIITPTSTEYIIPDALRIDRVYQTAFAVASPAKIIGNTIYFTPQQVGQQFYVRWYRKPTPLTSELIPLLVPDEYIDVLEDGVENRLESKEHGSKDNWRYWKKKELPVLQRHLNNNSRWGILNGTKTIQTIN